jgi:hypothetical protein
MKKRATEVQYTFVDSAPERLLPGTLYISLKYRAIVHLCLCGCNEKVLLRLDPSPDCWSFTFDGKSISIHDSVGNVGIPCRSHYIIKRNKVQWLPPLLGIDAESVLTGRPSYEEAEVLRTGWLPRWLTRVRQRSRS